MRPDCSDDPHGERMRLTNLLDAHALTNSNTAPFGSSLQSVQARRVQPSLLATRFFSEGIPRWRFTKFQEMSITWENMYLCLFAAVLGMHRIAAR